MRRVVALALVAALVGTACSSDPEPSVEGAPTSRETSDRPSTPANTRDEAPTSDAGTQAPTDAEPSEGATPTTGSPPSPSTETPTDTAPAGPGQTNAPDDDAFTPIPVGTYVYDTDGTSQFAANPAEDMPERTTLTAATPNSDDVQVITQDFRDDEGYGTVSELTVQYGVEGVVIRSSKNTTTIQAFGAPVDQTSKLVAMPPSIIAPTGAKPGFSTTFHMEGDGITVDGTVKILREEAVTVGSTTIDALVFELHYTFSGEVQGEQNSLWHVRPSDLLVLRDQTKLQASTGGFGFRQQYTSVLRSL